jgi:hypothetical protein
MRNPIPQRIPVFQVRVAPGIVLATYENREEAEKHSATVKGSIVANCWKYPDGAIRQY